MKVKALEGDTVDSLCFRNYGTTQGVTEKVLDANPGLCQQVFLDAGQEVEMPEPEKKKREMIQFWGSTGYAAGAGATPRGKSTAKSGRRGQT